MNLGILFDFNGTLIRDTQEQEQAWRVFAEKYAGRSISEEEFKHHVHGNHNDKVLTYLLGRKLDKEEAHKYSEMKEAIYRELCLENPAHFHLIEGAADFLTMLKEKQIPRTIATATPKSNLEFYFEQFGLAQWFDFNQTVYDDGTIVSKPDPDPYLKAAQKIHVAIEDCVILEDSLAGIQSGKAARGKKIIAVSNDGNNEKLAAMKEVAKVIDDFTEVTYADLL